MSTSDTEPDRLAPLLVSRREAARLLSVSEETIRRRQVRGELELVKVGNCARVRYRELLNLAGARDDDEG